MYINKNLWVYKITFLVLGIIAMLIGLVSCSGDDENNNDPKIFVGDITLLNQEEVNVFASENYSRITGTLTIGNCGQSNNINSLSSLKDLKSIGGNLRVIEADGLKTLNGLNNLEEVEGNISFGQPCGRSLLENLDGLESLISTGSLYIDARDSLKNIDALSNLKTCEELTVFGKYDNVDALSNLINVDFVSFNSSELTNLGGIAHLNNLSNLNLYYCTSLVSLQSLSSNLFQVGFLRISNCNSLVNLDGLSSLTEVGGIQLLSNENLENLDVLNNLEIRIKSLIVEYNPKLENFCGLKTPFENFGLPDTFKVNGNAYNPTEEQILQGNCSL